MSVFTIAAIGLGFSVAAQSPWPFSVGEGLTRFGVYVGLLAGGAGNGASLGTISDSNFSLFANNTDRMIVTNTGLVGIGTASPLSKLHIVDSQNTYATTLATSMSLSTQFIQTKSGSGAGIAFSQIAPNAQVIQGVYSDGSASTPLVLNPYGGNVGIGTTSPQNALNVIGDANITGDFIYGCPNTATNQMVKVGSFCIDKYEAYTVSGSLGNANGNNTNAVAGSKAGVLPQASVTWFQAAQECANAGKRLCTNAEWQTAVAGTPDPGADGGTTGCNVASRGTPANTGSFSACVSRWGVYDMVGNVWEWVADWGQAGSISQATYVAWADGTYTNTAWPDATYGADSIWNVNGRTYNGAAWVSGAPAAFVRGGDWGNGANAGSFALSLSSAPSNSYMTFGFRCCK